jgi:hypothetical protein
MKHRILKAVLAVLAVLALGASTASALPCTKQVCSVELTATTHVKGWESEASYGPKWLIYLNVYRNGKRLRYSRMDHCHAAYFDLAVLGRLTTCGTSPVRLRYAAVEGQQSIRIDYRAVAR